MTIEIRKARIEDAEGIADVGIKTWQTAYRGIFPDDKLDNMPMKDHTERRRQNIQSNSTDEKKEMIVAVDSEKGIIGYAGGGKYETTPPFDCEIGAIYVLQEFQGKGIGIQLVQWLLDFFQSKNWKTMIIWVLEDSVYSRFYEKLGGIAQEKKPYEKWELKKTIIGYVWDDIAKIQLDV